MRLQSLLLWPFLGSLTTLSADSITVLFDIGVYAKFDYLTKTYDPNFAPVQVSVPVVFDNRVTDREGDATDSLMFFGTPKVDSPLTGGLPYGPGTTTIDPPTRTRFSAISNYDFGPGSTGSYFQFGQDQENQDGPNRFYSYDMRIITPTNHPPVPNFSSFSGEDLVSYLRSLQADSAQIYFSEYSDHFDSSTLQYLGGIGYTGTGTISEVTSVPELPAGILFSFVVLAIGLSRAQTRQNSPQRG
ncbi:MAG TPA: hypothetical protein VNH83_13400 [Bryobacteraceae bacterium]|nr:hypothetical protein [Bryobacteraceae bacterium]